MNRENTKDLGRLLGGLGFRVALWPLVFTMLVAAFAAHGGAFNVQNGGMEYPLTLGMMVAGLALVGPGSLAVTRLVPRRAGATAAEVA